MRTLILIFFLFSGLTFKSQAISLQNYFSGCWHLTKDPAVGLQTNAAAEQDTFLLRMDSLRFPESGIPTNRKYVWKAFNDTTIALNCYYSPDEYKNQPDLAIFEPEVVQLSVRKISTSEFLGIATNYGSGWKPLQHVLRYRRINCR